MSRLFKLRRFFQISKLNRADLNLHRWDVLYFSNLQSLEIKDKCLEINTKYLQKLSDGFKLRFEDLDKNVHPELHYLYHHFLQKLEISNATHRMNLLSYKFILIQINFLEMTSRVTFEGT